MATGAGRGGVGKLENSAGPKMIDTQQQKDHHHQQQQQSDVSHESTDDHQQSDAVHEYTCSTCSQNDVTTDATHYCPKCDVCYCKACLCDHTVLGKSDIAVWGKQLTQRAKNHLKDSDQESTCLRHPEHNVTMYCRNHDVLCCKLCSSSDHRSCKNMETLSIAAEKDNIEDSVQAVNDDIQDLESNTEVLGKDSEIRKGYVISSHSNYNEQLENMKKKVLAKFETVKGEANTRKRHFIDKFDTDKLMCKNISEKIVGLKRTLEPVDEKQTHFIRVKRAREWVRGTRIEMKTILNANVSEVFQNIPRVDEAKVMEILTDVIDVKMAERKFSVETKEDDKECEIVGICQLANGNHVIADKANKCLKQLDTCYTVISRYNLQDTPRGICATGDSDIIVATNNNTILIVAVGAAFENVRILTFAHSCEGVAYQNEQFFITYTPSCKPRYSSYFDNSNKDTTCKCTSEIHIYDKDGNALKQMTAKIGEHDCSDCDNGTPICISEDGEKIFVAHRCGLAVFDSQGQTITSSTVYTNIGGLCVDSKGNLYVSLEKSKEVVQLKQERNCCYEKDETVKSSLDLSVPGAICYDKRLGRIVICQVNGSYIYLAKHTY